jgi:predicted phage tail protein
MDAASVAVRQPVTTETRAPNAVPRRAGYGQPVALMVVGGAALLAGLIIGGGAGTAIAVGGAVVGLYGLYEFLQ